MYGRTERMLPHEDLTRHLSRVGDEPIHVCRD
jgi:hypothetical protein